MTANQIAYMQAVTAEKTMLENARHNRIMEYETARTNRANELLKDSANKETARSNLAKESETSRSNKANEAIKTASHYENVRHNIIGEGISSANQKAQETHWTNSDQLGKDTLTATEANWLRQYGIDLSNVEIGWHKAESDRIKAGASVTSASAAVVSAQAAAKNADTNAERSVWEKNASRQKLAQGARELDIKETRMGFQNAETVSKIGSSWVDAIIPG